MISVVAGLILFASYKYQHYRVQKIEFILWDRQHQNDAQLTDSDLIRYVEACGATTAKSEGHVNISYRSVFIQKNWVADLKGK
jgi:hypothetical protein